MMRSRLTTIVFVDPDGSVLGASEPTTIPQPWWQEVAPIGDAMPGTTVLRLLEAEAEDGEEMGGLVTYLAEHAAPGELRPWPGELTEHPLRMPWAEPGGPSADLAWVEDQVDVTGPARQHRTWHLSAIWSIPTTDGTVWLKCVPPFFAHEAAVLRTLAELPVPRLLAADRHRLLLAELPGHDGYVASADEEAAMVDTLVDIQLASATRIDQLLAGGTPDLRADRMVAELTALVDRLGGDRPLLRRLLDEMADRQAEAARAGLPDTVVHGDPHGGNCRLGTSPPIWFDWGDAFIGNPLLDVAAVHRMGPPAVTRWLDRWAELVPGAKPHDAWRALEPIGHLRMAWVYQRFCDNIEPTERIFHRGDVERCLLAAEQALS